MISEAKAKQIIDAAIRYARRKVDGIEVTLSGSNIATSRFANNGMTQNQFPTTESVAVRVLLKGRQARLNGDDLSEKGLRALVDNAIVAVKLLEKDEELQPLIKPKGRRNDKKKNAVSRFDRKTAKMSAMDRAREVRKVIDVANAKSLIASGVYASGEMYTAIGNSAGHFVYHRETSAECSITMTAPDSSGWVKAQAVKSSEIDVQELAERAALKATMSANPQEIDPGKYTVILEPAAALDMIGQLWYSFAGTSHVDKLSCLLGKLGKKVFGDNVAFMDDVAHKDQSGAPFDGEGLPRQSLALVEDGVVKNFVYGRRSAKALKCDCTGHGLAEPSAMGDYPMNMVMKGGDSSVEEMVKSTDRGILVTRVWYVREVDPTTMLITGLTQDGTFLIENGAIKCGIKNMRFNVSVIEMLNSILAMSPEARTSGEEAPTAVMPALKVTGFNFTERTLY
ncbi:MAG: TldD/PmbA family protein [Candidatus Melainabacteria bacterium]|nr:TldD/PmbA family protein [Candidatus Melainabacteria bacterium]